MSRNKFDFDKVEWQYETANEIYCQEFHKSENELTEEDMSVIWENAANHTAFFLTWLIDNDFLNKLHEECADDIKSVKNRSMTGYEYLSKNCDMVLSREDLSRKIVKFADTFYYDYMGEYCEYMEEKLNRVVLGTRFLWEDYDVIKTEIIDVAYSKFLENRNKSKEK